MSSTTVQVGWTPGTLSVLVVAVRAGFEKELLVRGSEPTACTELTQRFGVGTEESTVLHGRRRTLTSVASTSASLSKVEVTM